MSDFWVFGYGSLMWRPGFPFEHSAPALLEGWHRAFCLWSLHWRGTPERPGLVLGLDTGGSCRGVAFRVAPERRDTVVEYLEERELIGYAYQARTLPVSVEGVGSVDAYTFVADRDHRHYAGDLGLGPAAEVIMDAQGVAGLNRDYLINTVRELERIGFADADLHALLVEIERRTGLIDRGAGI
jgi:cation transport protein ChaC